MRSRKAQDHPPLLPWFAAGKLDADEARRVEEHVRHCEECAEVVDSLKNVSRSLSAVAAEHIGIEELIDLESGRLRRDPVRAAWLEAHLSSCASCRGDLEALRGTRKKPWFVPAGPAKRWLLAAAAAVIVLATAWPILRNRWGAPEPGPVVLLPATRGEAPIPVLEGPGPWKIQCALPFSATSKEYRVRLEREDGTPLRRVEATYRPDGNARISMSLDAIGDPGVYRLVLEPAEGPAETHYSYTFRVRP